MTNKEIKEAITEMISCKEYELINETANRNYIESKFIKGFEKLISKEMTLTILIDLTKYFDETEQEEIKKIDELEFNNINYKLEYKN